MNAKVFINYRRDDTAPYAGRLYDRLTAHFGEDQVFIDIDQIEPGEDFVEAINRKVSVCDIAIVAIGPNWLRATDASGKRRLDDEEDFVRMEIVAALQRQIRVIPVLVGGARMPGRQDLPEALAPLSRRNAIELSETRFHSDVNRLIEAIEKSFAVAEKRVELSATPATPPPEPEKSQQDSIVTTKPTTPFKSTQTTPATPGPAPSASSISAFREPKVWTSKRWTIVTGVGATVILLLAITAVLLTRPYPPGGPAGTHRSKPDATLHFSGGSFAAGIGFSWGSVTLTYRGKDYPVQVKGLSIGEVGLTNASAYGGVYNLKQLQDFNGHYTVGMRVTAADGRKTTTMTNQAGVNVALSSSQQGVDVNAGGGGVDMRLKY
jgi:hypothetical protein